MARRNRPKSLYEGLIDASGPLVQRAAKTLRDDPLSDNKVGSSVNRTKTVRATDVKTDRQTDRSADRSTDRSTVE